MGHSRALKTSYFWFFAVPILAKVCLKLQEMNEDFTLFDRVWAIDFSLPFSWQIFYFSSVSFALATLFYNIWCPEFLKKYRFPSDLKKEGKEAFFMLEYFVANLLKHPYTFSIKHISSIRKLVERHISFTPVQTEQEKSSSFIQIVYNDMNTIQDYKNLFQSDDLDYSYTLPYNVSTSLKEKSTKAEEHYNRIFNDLIIVEDVRNRMFRIICISFYILGYILLAIIIIQNFVNVIEIIDFKELFSTLSPF